MRMKDDFMKVKPLHSDGHSYLFSKMMMMRIYDDGVGGGDDEDGDGDDNGVGDDDGDGDYEELVCKQILAWERRHLNLIPTWLKVATVESSEIETRILISYLV